tara:strand:+ start:1150 stop:1419 length:270 start_codon:yes stop_codon:yes gene_type:complete
MFSRSFEIFLNTLAYSFWPFVFFIAGLYIFNKYFNDSYKKKVKKEKKIRNIEPETHELAEKALNFKTPKIETSFGDQRIGEVHGNEEKD